MKALSYLMLLATLGSLFKMMEFCHFSELFWSTVIRFSQTSNGQENLNSKIVLLIVMIKKKFTFMTVRNANDISVDKWTYVRETSTPFK